jgi:hypothetical protein
VIAAFAVSPPAVLVSLSSPPPLQPAATSATAAVIAIALARFETLIV